MGLSRYPRLGQRIAPAMLHDILDVEIPFGLLPTSADKFRKLADLNESIWQTASEETCKLLAALVVKEVHRNLKRLPVMVRISTLPEAVSKIPLAELDLQVRTYNGLKKRFGDEVSTKTEIRDLLGIGDLGARSVVDFLVSVEAYAARPQQAQQLDLMVQVEPTTTVSLEECPSRIDVEISHYPRRGHRITPKTLKSLLGIPCGDRRLANLLLCDLDESMWDRLSPQLRNKLSAAVIKRVKVFRGALRNQAGQIRLPMPQTKGKPIVLQLERRTFNCLHERGLLDNPGRLAQMTVTELMAMSGFGEKSVVDLLSSLESQMTEAYAATSEVFAAAQKISRIKDAASIRIDDPRFGLALQALRVRGKTLQEICEVILAGAPCPMSAESFAHSLEELFSNLQIARRMPLENELMELLTFEPNARNRDFTMRLMGWDGNGGQTLEAVGKDFGMTRERIRQINQLHIDRVKDKFPYLPILDRTLEVILAQSPCLATSLESVFQEKRLSKVPFILQGVINAAEATGRDCSFIIEDGDGQSYVVPQESAGITKQILQLARKAISHWGVTTIEDVAAEVGSVLGKPVSGKFVAAVVNAQPSFAWLDEASGWFWFNSTSRNALLNQIEKILSLCERIHVTELRSGVSRNHRREGFAPPQRVLLALCAQAGAYKVNGNIVSADPPLEYASILCESEKTFVAVFHKIGPLVELHKLEEACLRQGMNQSTFGVSLSNSPIIQRFARCVYGLRGTEVSPGQAESFVIKLRKTRVLSDYGWTQDGKIFLSYTLSSGTLANGIVSVPTGMKQHLSGAYELRVAEGAPIGRLVVKDSQAWGLGPLFRRRGGDPGDSLRILFDLKKKMQLRNLDKPRLKKRTKLISKPRRRCSGVFSPLKLHSRSTTRCSSASVL
jgi:hypothetical protein